MLQLEKMQWCFPSAELRTNEYNGNRVVALTPRRREWRVVILTQKYI